ncbi:MAG TPA: hypothetical protein VFC47_03095 [Caulobacteraceae bacterium]|nr:hypothetical protein [Caulobacteraceae bacterium]
MSARDDSRPYRVISIVVSQGCELARWLLERAGLPFVEQFHAPLLHVLATTRVNGGVEAPVVVTPDGVWVTLMGIMEGIDAHSPAGRKVFGESEGDRLENEAFLAQLMPLFGDPLRRYVYHLVLPNKRVMYPLASAGAPAWERAVVYWFYPVWRVLLSRALGDAPADIAAAPGIIEQGMALVDAELARRGGRYLAGEAQGGIDVVVAALMSPAVFPPQYGGRLPDLADVPSELRDFVTRNRDRPGGRLALATYASVRKPS